MATHYHAYQWTGPTAQLDQADELRRPPASGGTEVFTTSALPPFRLCDWLRKPRARIARTFATSAEAVAWLAARYDETAPSFLYPDQEAKIGKDFRLENAGRDLTGGVDVCWGFHLKGERYAHLAVICCPNRHAPDHPCPAG